MRGKKENLSRLFLLLVISVISFSKVLRAEESEVTLDKAFVDATDLPSLQRGAKLFLNFCSGCHSLKYVRYNVMAKDIGIVNAKGEVLEQAVKDNLLFVGDKLSDPIKTAMTKEEGAAWFGTAPPDLSLVVRLRGVDWIYTYLRSFTIDPKRPWGVNNKVFPDVAMPDVLYNFRKRLLAGENGQEKYDAAVLDLVNFLNYVGEPTKELRKRIGVWVLLFLGIFFIFAWLLKREYWKDVD